MCSNTTLPGRALTGAAIWGTEIHSLRPLVAGTSEFADRLKLLRARATACVDDAVIARASEILHAVRTGGDQALLSAVETYDGVTKRSVLELLFEVENEAAASDGVPELNTQLSAEFRAAVHSSITAVRRFHEPQQRWIESGHYAIEADGLKIEERVFPLRRVGLYVPGGRFVYPSTVIMTVVPAQLAGVSDIVVACPPAALASSAELRYVLQVLGISEVWGMGGAHAIAALAYGTDTVRPVDFIAGPGNAWVTAAKQLVRGTVGTDHDAGPSEVVIVASGDAPATWVAADLIAQAEHDPRAVAVLVTPSMDLAESVLAALTQQLGDLATAETAVEALAGFGAVLVTEDLEQAFEVGESLAAEHQQLMGAAAEDLAPRCRAAGALFVGSATPTCFGDYAAGPSHVLPTGGTARYSSGLSVLDFVRRTHSVRANSEASASLGRTAAALAEVEGLVGHRRSAVLRAEALAVDAGESS